MASPWDRVSQAMQRNSAQTSGAAVESYGNMGRMAYAGLSEGLGGAIPAYQQARANEFEFRAAPGRLSREMEDFNQRAVRGSLQIAREQKELLDFDARIMRESVIDDLRMKSAQADLLESQAKLVQIQASTAEMMAQGAREDQAAKQAAQATEMQLRNMVTFDKDGNPMGVLSGDSASGFELGKLGWDDPRVQMQLRQSGLYRDPRSGSMMPYQGAYSGQSGQTRQFDRTRMHADLKAKLDMLATDRKALMENPPLPGASPEEQAEHERKIEEIDAQAEALLGEQEQRWGGGQNGAQAAPPKPAPGSKAEMLGEMDRFTKGGSRNQMVWEEARKMTGMDQGAFREYLAGILAQRPNIGGQATNEWFDSEIELLLYDIALNNQEYRERR